jgi:two-component system, NtrC family, response regulator AtoC
MFSMTILNSMGRVYFIQKKYEKSLLVLEEALQESALSDSNKKDPMILGNMAAIYYDMENEHRSIELIGQALLIARNLDQKSEIYSLTLRLADYYKRKDDFKKACEYYTIVLNCGWLPDRKQYDDLLKIDYNVNLWQQHSSDSQLAKIQDTYAKAISVEPLGIYSDQYLDNIKLAELYHEDNSVPVLIEGETGTGKEIIARIIHFGLEKSEKPFIVVNCAAIASSLFESELFGYVEGAFTGALKGGKMGLLERAQSGTVFFDEIGELPLDLQAKLLRLIQNKEMYRLGGTQNIQLDVRFVFATNKNLITQVKEGKFRADLYYRINAASIKIPPLRERKNEIGPLSQMFMEYFADKMKKQFKYINKQALRILENHDWDGNVRELQHAIRRIVLMYDSEELKPEYIQLLDSKFQKTKTENSLAFKYNEKGISMVKIEKKIIVELLERYNRNISHVAGYLQLTRGTLYNKMKSLGISV